MDTNEKGQVIKKIVDGLVRAAKNRSMASLQVEQWINNLFLVASLYEQQSKIARPSIIPAEGDHRAGSDPACVCTKHAECSTTSAAEAWNHVRRMLRQFTKTNMVRFDNTHWLIELEIANAGNPFPYTQGNRSQGWDLQLMLDHLQNEFLSTLQQDASVVVWLGKANAADDAVHCNAVRLRVRYEAGFPMIHETAAANVSEIELRAFARDTQLVCELVDVKYEHLGSASENFARAVSLAS